MFVYIVHEICPFANQQLFYCFILVFAHLAPPPPPPPQPHGPSNRGKEFV